MANQADVRRISLSFPHTREAANHFAFEVPVGNKYKGFAWVWLERIHPRKARVPCPGVLAIRVPNLDAKEILLMADPQKFFTEPHYDGYPAVLVRLKEIGVAELRVLLKDAWATLASKAVSGAPTKREPAAAKAAPATRRKVSTASRKTKTSPS